MSDMDVRTGAGRTWENESTGGLAFHAEGTQVSGRDKER
jgi:hypothetical protein